MKPIQGVRYKCANCPNYDLCSICEQRGTHSPNHVFVKINRAVHFSWHVAILPELWTPGTAPVFNAPTSSEPRVVPF